MEIDYHSVTIVVHSFGIFSPEKSVLSVINPSKKFKYDPFLLESRPAGGQLET